MLRWLILGAYDLVLGMD
jgi:hypothetical protein